MAFLVGVGVFVLEAFLMFTVVYPAVFNGIRGLFSNSDLGTAAGLVVCFLISGVAFSVALLVAFVTSALVGTRR